MVAPVVAAGLVNGAFSILGGLFGSKSKKKATAAQNWYNAPQQQRDRAEAAGFNPLFTMSNGASGNQMQSGYSPIMGNSIAQAGAAYADGKQAEEQLKIQRAELEMENERLDALVKATKLKENVGGIYSRRPQLMGESSDNSSSDPSDDFVDDKENITRVWDTDRAVYTDVPVGPDIDEIITGTVIAGSNAIKAEMAVPFAERQARARERGFQDDLAIGPSGWRPRLKEPRSRLPYKRARISAPNSVWNQPAYKRHNN